LSYLDSLFKERRKKSEGVGKKKGEGGEGRVLFSYGYKPVEKGRTTQEKFIVLNFRKERGEEGKEKNIRKTRNGKKKKKKGKWRERTASSEDLSFFIIQLDFMKKEGRGRG